MDVTDLKQLVWESKQGQQALIVDIQLSLSFWCWDGFVEQDRGQDFFHWVFYKCFSSCNWTTRQLALPSSSVQTCTPQAFPVQMPAQALETLFVKLFLLVFNSHNSRFWAKRLFSDPLNIFPFEAVKVAFNNSRAQMFFFFVIKTFPRSCTAAVEQHLEESAWGKAYLTFNPKLNNLTVLHCS